MTYFLDLFSPETQATFSASDRGVSASEVVLGLTENA